MNLRSKPRIGVMGPSACSQETWEIARKVGCCIAQRGGILICGGGQGVMEAAARGVKEAGGITIGILPGGDAGEANAYVDIPIVTDIGNARNVINILTSQVVIAVRGAYGTLSEIALALKCGTPVVGLDTWTLAPPAGEFMTPIPAATNPEEAVALAFSLIK